MKEFSSALLCASLLLAPALHAAPKAIDREGHQWWQHAVFYEIYPRSFADTNGDGIGDLDGIARHLDYLRNLGVDAIWLTPCYPSPQVDFGYDVSDYRSIDPMYGTLHDFDRLSSAAKQRNIRLIMDLVVNHTSDQHPWFKESRASIDSPKRDWYIWRDGKPNGQPPNNWLAVFGHSAWTLDPRTNQYYYHYFYPEQPDLNWRNPEVRDAMLDITRWWIDRGVAGFRLDAVDTLMDDPALTDNPTQPGTNRFGDPNQTPVHNTNLPELHDVLRDLRNVTDQHDSVLIGETWTSNIEQLNEYYREIQMPMDFMFTMVNRISAPEFRKQIALAESANGWPVYVISNHDMIRSYNRYGDGIHNDQIAKLLAALYLTLRGTPVMYYGEEIGMQNNDPTRREDVQDPIGKLGWPNEKGRDGERTPMQWNGRANAGFTTGKPWLPIPASYKKYNVDAELRNKHSILWFYKSLLSLRHKNRALLDGSYVPLNEDDPNVLAYLRSYGKTNVLVALNMSDSEQTVSFDLNDRGVNAKRSKVLLTTLAEAPADITEFKLPPFGVLIASVR
jgi:alpha-glucosidase